VTNLDLGPIGIATGLDSSPASLEAATVVEDLGYPTLWLNGGPLPGLSTVSDVVRATSSIRVATGILAIVKYDAAGVADLYRSLEAEHPGRLVVGLGGAHGPNPIRTLNGYLDALDSIPTSRCLLAALGPRMLKLARDRAAGAYPVLITPAYAEQARAILGADPVLAVQQLVVLERDASRAREIARRPLSFLLRVPAYAASFRRQGFTDDEIDRIDDRLVDAVIAWGDSDAIAARVSELHAAGVDHVALSVQTGRPDQPLPEWRELATALLPQP